jgi:hypothetical protein
MILSTRTYIGINMTYFALSNIVCMLVSSGQNADQNKDIK